MSELTDRLNREADEHEKFYPSDTLHGMLREAVARITTLEATIEKLPQKVVDRLFAPNDGRSVVGLVLEFERCPFSGPGWSRGAATYQVHAAIRTAEAAAQE